MNLELSRIIIFTADVPKLAAFYRSVIGLDIVGSEPGWVELSAGRCNIALHQGRPKIGNRPPKRTFYAADVATARALLIKRGMDTFGPIKSTATFDMCDGRDPDGNPIQISSRAEKNKHVAEVVP
jgi:catechol 2,3-dioxygenase-like lactoylglutathione lyase family enzyme